MLVLNSCRRPAGQPGRLASQAADDFWRQLLLSVELPATATSVDQRIVEPPGDNYFWQQLLGTVMNFAGVVKLGVK